MLYKSHLMANVARLVVYVYIIFSYVCGRPINIFIFSNQNGYVLIFHFYAKPQTIYISSL